METRRPPTTPRLPTKMCGSPNTTGLTNMVYYPTHIDHLYKLRFFYVCPALEGVTEDDTNPDDDDDPLPFRLTPLPSLPCRTLRIPDLFWTRRRNLTPKGSTYSRRTRYRTSGAKGKEEEEKGFDRRCKSPFNLFKYDTSKMCLNNAI